MLIYKDKFVKMLPQAELVYLSLAGVSWRQTALGSDGWVDLALPHVVDDGPAARASLGSQSERTLTPGRKLPGRE